MNDVTDIRQFRPKLITFSDVANVGIGTTTGEINTAKSIHELQFIARTSAGVGLTRSEIIADITSIKIFANGVILRDMTATELLDYYKFYHDAKGAHTVAGVIPIEFTRPFMDLRSLSNDLALGMKGVNLTYEIAIKAVAVLDSIEVRAIVDDRIMPLGRHIRVIPINRSVAATGQKDWSTLPTQGKTFRKLLAYHVVLDSGVISELNVIKNNEEVIFQQASKETIALLLNSAGRKAQSGYFHIPFDLGNDPRAGENLGSDTAAWLVQPTFTTKPTGENARILDEYMTDGLAN